MPVPRPTFPPDRVADVCRRYRISELSLFGSALRDDFNDESDVDFLVEFEPGGKPDFATWLELRDELVALAGREVDLVQRRLLTNPIRRQTILSTRRVLYAA